MYCFQEEETLRPKRSEQFSLYPVSLAGFWDKGISLGRQYFRQSYFPGDREHEGLEEESLVPSSPKPLPPPEEN